MPVRVARSLAEVEAADWNALAPEGAPLLRHEFLRALEASGCATAETGWDAHHLLHHGRDGRLDGAMPLYLKSHSWGEFVFDFAWAEAHQRGGLPYYPRFVSAVPFTPATGPRLLARDEAVRRALLEAARELVREQRRSSLHLLFASDRDRGLSEAEGLLCRLDCQYHWRDDGYGDFDGFLAAMTAEKRKKLRRERRRAAESGLQFRRLAGGELDERQLEALWRLHALTFARYGQAPYLNAGFFRRLARDLPEALVVDFALRDGEEVACAVFLRGPEALYGRYWGAAADYHSLHFELCFYRGIEYCLAEGLRRFEPGAQGEHKLLRGFAPTPVWSLHEIADARLASAIDVWLARERARQGAWLELAGRHLPFRRAPAGDTLGGDVRHRLAEDD